ncbi:MAG: glutamate mutase L [Candidatus Promineifilaceae bacterium]
MTLDTPTPPQLPEDASFLIAECGTAFTAVSLIDQAIGTYRLIGRSTVPTTIISPWLDVMEGVQQGIRRVTQTTGRTLIGDSGRLIRPTRQNGSGIDAFGAVVSAAEPVTIFLVGLFDDVSIASARRAIHTIYAREVGTISLSDTRSESDQVEAILQSQPDVILVVGGTDGGAEARLKQLIETVSLGIHVLAEIKRPQVIYAGNRKLREYVQQKLGVYANVQVANNVRPSLENENIGDTARLLTEIYEDLKVSKLPGFQELHDWSTLPVTTAVHAFKHTVEYFANLYQDAVLGIDLGSNQVTLIEANPDSCQLYINSQLGMGAPIENVLTAVSPEKIASYMPTEISSQQITDTIYNKALTPHTIATTQTDIQLEQAIAKMILQKAATKSGLGRREEGYRLVIARGATLTQTARPGQALLTILDALMPTGIFAVLLDKYNALPALGAIARHHPLSVVQALNAGVLTDLGWVIAPAGRAPFGQKAVHVTMESESSTRLEIEVGYGSLEILPLAPGHKATVTIKPEKRFDVGFGPGKSKKLALSGGAVGIVVDARGRPLRYPANPEKRQEIIRQWLWDMGG